MVMVMVNGKRIKRIKQMGELVSLGVFWGACRFQRVLFLVWCTWTGLISEGFLSMCGSRLVLSWFQACILVELWF